MANQGETDLRCLWRHKPFKFADSQTDCQRMKSSQSDWLPVNEVKSVWLIASEWSQVSLTECQRMKSNQSHWLTANEVKSVWLIASEWSQVSLTDSELKVKLNYLCQCHGRALGCFWATTFLSMLDHGFCEVKSRGVETAMMWSEEKRSGVEAVTMWSEVKRSEVKQSENEKQCRLCMMWCENQEPWTLPWPRWSIQWTPS
jgi:hypothetical protein